MLISHEFRCLCGFFPTYQKCGVNVYVHGPLWGTGVPCDGHHPWCITPLWPFFPGIGSGSTATLTRTKSLLKMDGWMNIWMNESLTTLLWAVSWHANPQQQWSLMHESIPIITYMPSIPKTMALKVLWLTIPRAFLTLAGVLAGSREEILNGVDGCVVHCQTNAYQQQH